MDIIKRTDFKFVNGLSSLLFIISAYKSVVSSNILIWKIGNVFLVFSSFMYNSLKTSHTEIEQTLLWIDNMTIYYISIGCLNTSILIYLLHFFILLEYFIEKTINKTKKIAFLLAVGKSIICTFLYLDEFHFYTLLVSSILSIGSYAIRNYLENQNNYEYTFGMTWIWHICIAISLYISSITAI